jgi:hypothetical protein
MILSDSQCKMARGSGEKDEERGIGDKRKYSYKERRKKRVRRE